MAIDRELLRNRIGLAAGWFVNAQCRMQRPCWMVTNEDGAIIALVAAARVWDHAPAKEYIAKALPHLLALQIVDEKSADQGAFLGEDEAPKWYSGGTKSDYVKTRATAYSALALAKIEGTVVTGGYSSEAELPVRAQKLERKP